MSTATYIGREGGRSVRHCSVTYTLAASIRRPDEKQGPKLPASRTDRYGWYGTAFRLSGGCLGGSEKRLANSARHTRTNGLVYAVEAKGAEGAIGVAGDLPPMRNLRPCGQCRLSGLAS